MRTLIVTLCLAGAAWAQGGSQDQPDRMTEWWIGRMKDQLKLSDEQLAKVKEIYKESSDNQKKADKEREDKVLGVLSDEQKKGFEELKKNPMGGARGGRGNGNGGGGGAQGWMQNLLGPTVDQLKKDLNLDDKQTEKVKVIVDEFRDKMTKRMDELRQGGFQGLNWQEEMKKFQDELTGLGDRIKEHLTPEQKEKYDKLIDERFNFQRWMGGGGGGGGNGRGGRRGPSVEDRAKRVMDALKIEDEKERSAVDDLVKKIITAKDDYDEFDRGYREKARELVKSDLGEEALEAKLKELRDERRSKEKAVSGLQKELAEIVSFRQELTLVEQGILK